MISYAQNLEDVMLWRALKQVGTGFYIDVGANDPNLDSVTRTFYNNGWRGINIEPCEPYFRDLERDRPKDINLNCAVGRRKGTLKLWDCGVRGWPTADKAVIAQHIRDGYHGTYHQVPVLRLAEICKRHVSGPIHFLKIDVEGLEKDVIEGMDFTRFRPWVLVIEATRPNSTVESYEEWESRLLQANYVLAYVDGLNRFYLANEKNDLLRFFRFPPNVFDEFVRADFLSAQANTKLANDRAQQAELLLQTLRSELSASHHETQALQSELSAAQESRQQREREFQQMSAELSSSRLEARTLQLDVQALRFDIQALRSSHSWRVTTPLRWGGMKLRKLPGVNKVYTFSKDPVGHAIRFVVRRNWLKGLTHLLLVPFPRVAARLRMRPAAQLITNLMTAASPTENPPDLSAEPESVRRIYRQLSWARNQNLKSMGTRA